MAVISAADFCDSEVTRRRRSPTNFVRRANMGKVPTAMRVNSHDMINIATSVLMNITTLDSTFDTVLVTTFWTPATSLETRACISPVRVPVKKFSDRLWR